jgi:competence protein ComEC
MCIRDRYSLVKNLWSLVALSISAQLATFPLCLFYFHQFPNYFILTNIVAIPLSAIVIYLGIAYLMFYSVPFLSVFLSKALTLSLLGLNNSISFIEGLPYSVSRAISVTDLEMFLIYLIIVSFCAFLILKKPKMILASMMFVLILMCSLTSNKIIRSTQKNIVVYNVNRHTAIDFMDGDCCYFITDSLFGKNLIKQEYPISGSRIKYKIQTVNTLYPYNDSSIYKDNIFYQNHEFICFAGKKLVIVDRATTATKQIAVDMVLISNNPKISMEMLLRQYRPKFIVTDASNYQRNISYWFAECNKKEIPFYATSKSGALVYEF